MELSFLLISFLSFKEQDFKKQEKVFFMRSGQEYTCSEGIK